MRRTLTNMRKAEERTQGIDDWLYTSLTHSVYSDCAAMRCSRRHFLQLSIAASLASHSRPTLAQGVANRHVIAQRRGPKSGLPFHSQLGLGLHLCRSEPQWASRLICRQLYGLRFFSGPASRQCCELHMERCSSELWTARTALWETFTLPQQWRWYLYRHKSRIGSG